MEKEVRREERGRVTGRSRTLSLANNSVVRKPAFLYNNLYVQASKIYQTGLVC